MHLVGFLLTLNYDARNHELEKYSKILLHNIHFIIIISFVPRYF